MPRFKGGDTSLSPLAIQLAPDAGQTVQVVGWFAASEVEAGTATNVSRPVLSRPSLLGTGVSRASAIQPVTNPGAVPSASLLTQFFTPPSFPSVTVFTALAPFQVQWAADPENGLIVPSGGALLLYALGPTWDGFLEWDEP